MTGDRNGLESEGAVALLRDVVKHYRGLERPVLDGVDLEIRGADLVAIVGASGAGKTTLLNVLGCIDQPTRGSYRLGSHRIDKLNEEALASVRARHLGYVFQNYYLIEHLTVVQNLETRFLYGDAAVPEDYRDRLRNLLVRLGIEPLSDKHPRHLSGGEMQRVAIARALVSRPRILLADEPTGNLDERNAETVFELLVDATRQGTSVVLVTHDAALAARCPSRFVLRRGRLEAC